MNWNLCALCQADGLDLIDPRNNRNSGVCGYARLVTNINAFVDEGLCLSSKIKVSINDLKGNSDILTNLQHNNAKCHKSCALELLSSRLQRARFSRDKMRQNEDGLNEAPNDVPVKTN